jgi:hypothetical protein
VFDGCERSNTKLDDEEEWLVHRQWNGLWGMAHHGDELCGAECYNLLGPAFIEFDRAQMGHFQFGTVRGWLACRFGEDVARGRSKGIASKDDCISHFRCVAPDLSRSTTPGAGTMNF